MIIEKIREQAKLLSVPVMRVKTAERLAMTVSAANPKCVLEIGTALGVSALTVLTNSNAKLVTIEKNIDLLEKAKKNIKNAGFLDRTEFILGDCLEAVRLMDGAFDFAVLDGPKSHYLELTKLIIKLMPGGGTIFADDIGYHGMINSGYDGHKHRTIVKNMESFIDYITNSEQLETKFFDIEDGIAVIKVK